MQSQKLIVIMLLLGLLSLPFLFFERRIGGEGGGSEKSIVGALWLIAAIVLAYLITRAE